MGTTPWYVYICYGTSGLGAARPSFLGNKKKLYNAKKSHDMVYVRVGTHRSMIDKMGIIQLCTSRVICNQYTYIRTNETTPKTC